MISQSRRKQLETHFEFLGKLAEVCEKTSEMERVRSERPFDPSRCLGSGPRAEETVRRQLAHSPGKLSSRVRNDAGEEMSELVLDVRGGTESDCDLTKLPCTLWRQLGEPW